MTLDPHVDMNSEKEPLIDDADLEDVQKVKDQIEGLRHELAQRNQVLFNLQKRRNGNGVESTTGRVIEQLQTEIDNLRRELHESKAQTQAAKLARERADRQSQEYLNSHESLRTEIESLKRMLERKERQVKELEGSSKENERRHTDMRFERDNANTKLRQTELKVSSLERKLTEALAGKEQAEHEYLLLSKEMKSFKRRYAEDVDIVKKEFLILREQLHTTTRQLEDVILMTGIRIEEITSDRKDEIETIESAHAKLQENQEKYAAQFLSEIEKMKEEIEISSKKTIENVEQVTKMKGEISGKLNWLSRIEKAQMAS